MRNITYYKKIIFVHKGAFGDFLQIWPSIYSICEQFKDKKDFFWGGREEYFTWLKPLNIKLLNAKHKIMLDNIYSGNDLPDNLKDFLIFWFVLKKVPSSKSYKNIFFIKGLERDYLKIWRQYLINIEKIGIKPCEDWQDAWKSLFISQYNPERILIFPGSGHRLKNWPIVNFIELAHRLVSLGEKVTFVLGPVEFERRVHIDVSFDIICSCDFDTLQKNMLNAKLVIGNDSGPLHLAGFNGITNISLFGPTNPCLWAPIGSRIVKSNLPCSPCTSLIDIKCKDNICITGISTHQVFMEVKALLNRKLI